MVRLMTTTPSASPSKRISKTVVPSSSRDDIPAIKVAASERPPVDIVERPKKITAHGLSFFYGASQALFDMSLTIPEKCVSAFIGPSGCGKSTFLRCLNRMNDMIEGRVSPGSIQIDGTDIYDPKTDVVELRKRVGMVFQKSNPFPKSIFENIAYGPRVAGLNDRAKLKEIVETCLKQAALWTEVKGSLGRFGSETFRWTAATAVYRPSIGNQPGCSVDG